MKEKQESKPKKKTRLKHPAILTPLIGAGVAVLLGVGLLSFIVAYRGQVYPNTYIGSVNFGGKTMNEAESLLQDQVKALPQEVTISVASQPETKVTLQELAPEFDIPSTVNDLYAVGRTASLPKNILTIARSLVSRNEQMLHVKLSDEVKQQVLSRVTTLIGTQASDAKITLNEDGSLTVMPEKEGHGVLPEEVSTALITRLGHFQTRIELSPHPLKPHLTAQEVEPALDDIKKILNRTPLTVTSDDKKTTIDTKTVFTWITYVQPETSSKKTSWGIHAVQAASPSTVKVTLDTAEVREYLTDFAKTLNREAQNATLEAVDGTIRVSKAPVDGRSLNVDTAVAEITKQLVESQTATPLTIALQVEVTKAKINGENTTELGIKELIGRGETDFKGSPANRVHNITNGTKFLSGILIPPGEEFSTVKALGAVDDTTGYLPELVIKENRTTPEYGGGLCQVSTTLFRSVLNAGLKVTQRQNHSYRVSYYEPPVGLDATIYLPGPDFRFKNDTPAHILVQGRVQGTKVIFELYGTKDGRVSTLTNPIVSNITDPPPPLYADTDTLPKGEVKQIEKERQGASAEVTYTVMRDGKEINKQVFKSKYKAWQARYLVGTKE